jgi:hypothetical protein
VTRKVCHACLLPLAKHTHLTSVPSILALFACFIAQMQQPVGTDDDFTV